MRSTILVVHIPLAQSRPAIFPISITLIDGVAGMAALLIFFIRT